MGNNLSSGGDPNGRNNTSGNSQETSGMGVPNIPLLRRTTGSLGLTRSELDKRCKPSGLYATCTWDDRSIRREIGDGRLAARLVGKDGSSSSTDVECPICFLNYSHANETTCCKAHICTECFLQIRPMHEDASCPFCNSTSLKVKRAIIKSDKSKSIDSEAIIPGKKSCDKDPGDFSDGKPDDGEFGSYLRKSRTESMSSEDTTDESGIATISPHEREKIEAQMRQQNHHPVAQRIDMQAEEQRQEHDRTYLRSNSGLRRFLSRSMLNGRNRMGGRGLQASRGRNLNDFARFIENYSEDRVQTLDDLIMVEAALVLSMEQEARRSRGEHGENSTPAEHVRPGFPMLQALMERRAAAAEGQQNEENTDEEDAHMARLERRMRDRRNRRGGWSLGHHGPDNAAARSLSLRGVTEEQQMEMAIAASLRESHSSTPDSNDSVVNTDNANDQETESAPAAAEERAALSSAAEVEENF